MFIPCPLPAVTLFLLGQINNIFILFFTFAVTEHTAVTYVLVLVCSQGPSHCPALRWTFSRLPWNTSFHHALLSLFQVKLHLVLLMGKKYILFCLHGDIYTHFLLHIIVWIHYVSSKSLFPSKNPDTYMYFYTSFSIAITWRKISFLSTIFFCDNILIFITGHT